MRKLLGFALTALLATPALAGSGHGSQVKFFLMNTGVQPAATGKLLFVSNPAQSMMKLSVSKMTPGIYDVVLDGAVVDQLTVNSKGKGQLRHRSLLASKKSTGSPIPYDPRGAELAIASAGTALLEGDIPETPAEGQEHVEIEAELTNLGVVSGEAEASFEARSGRMQFEVELEDAPPGTYDLLVDGVKVGDITVGPGGEGEIEFDSVPSVGDDDDDQGDEEGGGLDLLLTFDPRGKEIVIGQAGVAQFSTIFPLVGSGDDDQGEDDDDQGEDEDGD